MNWRERIEAQIALINNYLGNGGFFNPELMDHDKVRDMVMDNRAALQALLDVAVAANKFVTEPCDSLDEINAHMYEIGSALDKLREVGDEL